MKKGKILSVGSAALFGALAVSGAALAQESTSSKNAETSVVTNENGLVTKMYSEANVSTNGNIVTTKKFITVTTLDPDGNIVGSKTTQSSKSESRVAGKWTVDGGNDKFLSMDHLDPVEDVKQMFRFVQLQNGLLQDGDAFVITGSVRPAQGKGTSFRSGRFVFGGGVTNVLVVADDGNRVLKRNAAGVPGAAAADGEEVQSKSDFSFLGIKLGAKLDECGDSLAISEIKGVSRWPIANCKRYGVRPPKKLDGFTCEVWVTPKTRKIVGIVAKAPKPKVDVAGIMNDYDYVFEALKRKYGEPTKSIRPLGHYWHIIPDKDNLKNHYVLNFRRVGEGIWQDDGVYAMISVQDLELNALAEKEVAETKRENARTAEEEAKKRLEAAIEAF